jgi:dienelactone hydrolase
MFGVSWPSAVAIQVHLNDADEWSELDVATDLVTGAADGELFLYPGSSHLFTDSSLADYVPQSAELVLDRTLALLRRWP